MLRGGEVGVEGGGGVVVERGMKLVLRGGEVGVEGGMKWVLTGGEAGVERR